VRERHDISRRDGKLLAVHPEPATAVDQDVERDGGRGTRCQGGKARLAVGLPGARWHEAELQRAGEPDPAQHVRQGIVLGPDSRRCFSAAWPKTALPSRRKCRALFNANGGYPMQAGTDKLLIVATKGIDSGLSSVAFTIANGGLTAGLKVSIFLTSTAIDLVRKRGHELTHVAPLQPLAALIQDFQKRGGEIWACPPCVKSRGYVQADLIDGVTIVGASALHEPIKQGAATLSV